MAKNSSSNKRNGSSVENLVERNIWIEALMYSGLIYLYVIALGVWGVCFITVDSFWQLLLGTVFLAPPLIITFAKAKAIGERDFKLKNRAVLTDIHMQRIVKVSPFKSLLYMLPFVALSLLIIFLGELLKVRVLQFIALIVFMPTTLVFQGLKLIELASFSWYAMLSVSVMVALVVLLFFLGYWCGVRSMRIKNEEMVNEIRSFE